MHEPTAVEMYAASAASHAKRSSQRKLFSYITHYTYLVRVAVLSAHHVLWHVDTEFTYIFSKLCDVT